MLEIKDLTFAYTKGDYIFRNLNVSLSEHKTYGLMGQSGSGKSTLLNIISGLQKLEDGKIYLRSREITSEGPAMRKVGYVFQDYGLFPHLSVAENIAFGYTSRKLSREEIQSGIDALLETMQLTPLRNQNVDKLSGGQKQRVALARTLASSPEILLLDEVFSAIDNEVKSEIRANTKQIIESRKMTTLMVSHSFDDICHLCNEVFFVTNRQIVGPFKPIELILNPHSRSIANLIGVKNIIKNKFGSVNGYTKNFLFVPETAIVSNANASTQKLDETDEYIIVNGIKFAEFGIENQKLYINKSRYYDSIFIDWTKVVEIDD